MRPTLIDSCPSLNYLPFSLPHKPSVPVGRKLNVTHFYILEDGIYLFNNSNLCLVQNTWKLEAQCRKASSLLCSILLPRGPHKGPELRIHVCCELPNLRPRPAFRVLALYVQEPSYYVHLVCDGVPDLPPPEPPFLSKLAYHCHGTPPYPPSCLSPTCRVTGNYFFHYFLFPVSITQPTVTSCQSSFQIHIKLSPSLHTAAMPLTQGGLCCSAVQEPFQGLFPKGRCHAFKVWISTHPLGAGEPLL